MSIITNLPRVYDGRLDDTGGIGDFGVTCEGIKGEVICSSVAGNLANQFHEKIKACCSSIARGEENRSDITYFTVRFIRFNLENTEVSLGFADKFVRPQWIDALECVGLVSPPQALTFATELRHLKRISLVSLGWENSNEERPRHSVALRDLNLLLRSNPHLRNLLLANLAIEARGAEDILPLPGGSLCELFLDSLLLVREAHQPRHLRVENWIRNQDQLESITLFRCEPICDLQTFCEAIPDGRHLAKLEFENMMDMPSILYNLLDDNDLSGLKSLKIMNCGLDDDHLDIIGSALKTEDRDMRALENITLSGNDFSEEEAHYFVEEYATHNRAIVVDKIADPYRETQLPQGSLEVGLVGTEVDDDDDDAGLFD